MKKLITYLALLISAMTLTACANATTVSAEANTDQLTETAPAPIAETATSIPAELSDTNPADDSAVVPPEGWTEETHSNDVDPNYAVVFPDDKVNQITITISPENWIAMQANMTELLGEAGSGGVQGLPADGQPDLANRPQPGDGIVPEGSVPPEGIPEGAAPPEGINPPAKGERPGLLNGGPGGGRPGEIGVGAGDMTSENPMWINATIEFEGNIWTNVGVRYKGNSSLSNGWRSGTLKLPLKLDFDEFEDEYPEIDNQRFYGFKQLSLANGYTDTSFLRDTTVSNILEDAGLAAANTAFYEVILDYGDGAVSLGLYTMIEVIDDTVVERTFGSDEGNIYEAEGTAASFAASTYNQIEVSFQKENNKDSDWADIETLYDVLHDEQRTIDPAAWRTNLEAIFDVDTFLEWLAITSTIQNWDAYGSMSHNYYLYNNPDTGQLTWISWDHNEALSAGKGGNRGSVNQNDSLDKSDVGENWPLIRFLLDDPVYYELYLGYLAETIAGPFEPNQMAEKYQTLADLIAPYAAAEVGEAAFEAAVQQLIDHTYQRSEAVQEFLSSIEP